MECVSNLGLSQWRKEAQKPTKYDWVDHHLRIVPTYRETETPNYNHRVQSSINLQPLPMLNSSGMANAGVEIAAPVPSAPLDALTGAAVVSGSSASTHPTQPIRYHVFLSFRGPDTRTTFTDHLYSALVRRGIVTFKDDEEIDLGDAISEKLLEAIQQSLCFVIVLSQKFASSRWCLDELQQILAIRPKRTVIPLFYHVQPGDIGHQEGRVKQAFAELKEKHKNEGQIERWRQALFDVAKIAGAPDMEEKSEAKQVDLIVTRVWNELCDKLPSNFEYLVGGIQSKAERIISLLRIRLDDSDKRFIGIWGMGGAGKTTLGRVVYDSAKKEGNFVASCFLTDIREDSKKFGLVHLQKKLLYNLNQAKPDDIRDHFHGAEIIRHFLSGKKVLIVLDDVSHRSQLDNLARNEEWFGAGSKIIITTRDKHLLTQYKDCIDYKVDMLCADESLKLLRQKAFKKDQPGEGFSDLSNKVVRYAGGHPMALEALGSFLCTREENEWRRTTDTLRQSLNKEILSQLHISYDELEEKYKTIFLDIACFLNKKAKFEVENVLKICDLDEIVGIKVLTEKSLLSSSRSSQTAKEQQNVQDNLQKKGRNTGMAAFSHKALKEEASKEYLYMHCLLQEMGRNIVYKESPINAGGRSRLWSLEDINLVLKENKGTEHVQCIVLETQDEEFEADWDPNCFSKMINLRLLDLSKVRLLRELKSLPTSLKLLRWDGYALGCLPSIETLWNLECLQLCNSNIQTLWGKKTPLNNLRIIDMSGSECLSETPDFSGTPNLEELLLDGCRNLTWVHDSVKRLEKLVKLSLKECAKLEVLPTKLKTNNLREFILMGCRKLRELPKFGKNMKSLYFIDVSNTRISHIPPTIKYLINLKILDLWECNELKFLPVDLPPALIACPSSSPYLRKEIAQRNLSASRVPEGVFQRPENLQGPIHKFHDSNEAARILEWFEKPLEYCWGKDKSGEFVTIAVDIPSNVVAADSNEECWGIAVCLFLKPLSQAKQSYMVWKFQYQSQANKTNMQGGMHTPDADEDDWGVYVGFYPFDKEKSQQHPTVNLTLSWLPISTTRDVRDLAIMGCQWRLASKLELDERWTKRTQSPSGQCSRNWERVESSRSATERKGKRKTQENWSPQSCYDLRSRKALKI